MPAHPLSALRTPPRRYVDSRTKSTPGQTALLLRFRPPQNAAIMSINPTKHDVRGYLLCTYFLLRMPSYLCCANHTCTAGVCSS